ncbi:MAG: hypothetical protein QF701_15820 [Nitrospinota bacterium]|nr:hypothetical protein [Nitrospinota bacterium]MDP7169196.1 hypothetical protein [Nitrospinota bacterium]MDP7505530.1 hypothetical protein [Nitrospinota bacterium]
MNNSRGKRAVSILGNLDGKGEIATLDGGGRHLIELGVDRSGRGKVSLSGRSGKRRVLGPPK